MKIVIVGGGTAGWLAALHLSKVQPGHQITLIESEDIGIIGAGEGSTALLSEVLSNNGINFGCDENEFMVKTGATMKYGIRHKGWTSAINDSYVGPIDGSTTQRHPIDVNFLYAIATQPTSEIHCKSSGTGFLIDNKKSAFSKDLKSQVNIHAYHFDAHLVGKYFKEICLAAGVTRLNDQVNLVNLDTNGNISSLLLKSGLVIEGDLFVDCTGFKRLLISAVGSTWISYKKWLPVNTALPFNIQYKDNEIIEPTTLAWAQNNGWMWRIPVKDRYGAGYVFDDNFVSPEQAQDELEKNLGHKIDPIRLLKFDTGRLDKFWNKNCVAFGLSSAFTEPLEATSIHSTIVMLRWFVMDFLKETKDKTFTPINEKTFNQRCDRMFETFKDFLVMHYMGGRTDTEFWRYISSGATETEFVKSLKEICKSRVPTLRDFENFEGSAGWGIWSFVLAGTGHITKEAAQAELQRFNIVDIARERYHETETYLENTFLDLLTHTDYIRILQNDPTKLLRI